MAKPRLLGIDYATHAAVVKKHRSSSAAGGGFAVILRLPNRATLGFTPPALVCAVVHRPKSQDTEGHDSQSEEDPDDPQPPKWSPKGRNAIGRVRTAGTRDEER
jgi:hypothetical protein